MGPRTRRPCDPAKRATRVCYDSPMSSLACIVGLPPSKRLTRTRASAALLDYARRQSRRAARLMAMPVPRVVLTSRVANAAVDLDERVLLNPQFLEWLMRMDIDGDVGLAVFGHELSHIDRGHLDEPWRSSYAQELEADFDAGCVVAEVCGDPEDFLDLLDLYTGGFGTASHPPVRVRARAVRRGWNSCAVMC